MASTPPGKLPDSDPDHVARPPRRRRTEDLIEHLKEVTDKLARDGSSRGDLKIISRTVRELRYAFKVFAPYRGQRKVAVFGSARTEPQDESYQQAVQFGRGMAEQNWLVITGAASGIMEAGHVGAGRRHSMGLNILLPFEQGANSIIAGDQKLVHMKYFFTRKLMFVKECDAVVCLPGGFGTLDEALEVLTLLQTGKRDMVPVVFLEPPGRGYWKSLLAFFDQHLLQAKLISPEDTSLYMWTDDHEAAVRHVLDFYRVYHSMRFVNELLVLRLNQALSPADLDPIGQEFSDILAGGAFKLTAALPAELDDPALSELPRLTFAFNRRSHGRLRQLIDHLNALGAEAVASGKAAE